MAVMGCGDDNSPPSMALILDQQVTVGESLRVPLNAPDPDGDRIAFTVDGLPDGASITSVSNDAALLSWSPAITDTAPGGRRYEVEARASDGSGGIARQRFGIVVFPTFGIPTFDLPSGVVLNLAQNDDLALFVEVKDDDTTDVVINLVEGPQGSRLQTAGSKTAVFYWKPDDEQKKTTVHRAVMRAQDESHQVDHVLTLVLLNAEKDAGCEGTPPSITHSTPADQELVGGDMVLFANMDDGDSLITSAQLHWTVGDPNGTYQTELMEEVNDDGQWTSVLPVGTPAPSGTLLSYFFTATDNDDATGIACDQTARRPKSGWFTLGLYEPGVPPTLCVDDSAEPDNTPDAGPSLKPDVYAGRRICGSFPDYAKIDAPENAKITARVIWDPSHGPLTLELVDGNDNTLAADNALSDSELLVSHEVLGDEVVYTRVASPIPSARLSYTLEINVDEVDCAEDDSEPNSAPDQATPAGVGLLENRQICPADSDFYRVSMNAGDTLVFAIDFQHQYGDLDLELRGPDGVESIAVAASENSREELEYTSDVTQDVYIRVYGNGGARNAYDLSIAPPGAGGECSADTLGQNVTPDVAATVFSGVYENLVTCAEAPDWLVIGMNGGDRLTLLVEPDPGQSVSVSLFSDPSGAPISNGTMDASGDIEIVYETPVAGDFYYKVSTPTGAATYDLLQDISTVGFCQDDRLEPNSEASPKLLPFKGIHTHLKLCDQSDVDAFLVNVELFQTLTVMTVHELSAGFTDLRLISPSGVVAQSVTDTFDGVFAEILVDEPGTWTVVIDPFDVQGFLPYDLAVFTD